MTTIELIKYYADLLIIQYFSKPKARGMISTNVAPIVMVQTTEQTLTFSAAPVSGSFNLTYLEEAPVTILWDDSASDIQTKLRAVTGLSEVLVTGEITDGSITISFAGVTAPASLLVVSDNTLENDVTIASVETDLTLPLAVQDGYNLVGDNPAVGVQLDTLGKYAGVVRTGVGFNNLPITLNDESFLSLIKMAVIKNSAGSSLSDIQSLLHAFFPGQIIVQDNQDMTLNYLVSSALGSPNLLQMFINQGLLPKPMAVGIGLIIYAPIIDKFFGFSTYELQALSVSPFNDYEDYRYDWPWLTYENGIFS